jgi:hypothetical protein
MDTPPDTVCGERCIVSGGVAVEGEWHEILLELRSGAGAGVGRESRFVNEILAVDGVSTKSRLLVMAS